MKGIGFMIRTVLAVGLLLFLVLPWAVAPLLNPEVPLNVGLMSSVFFSTTIPTTPVRELLLLARLFFGMMVVLYIFIPGLTIFFEFATAWWNNTVTIALAGLSVIAYLAAIVIYFLTAL